MSEQAKEKVTRDCLRRAAHELHVASVNSGVRYEFSWHDVDILRAAAKRIDAEGNPYIGFADSLPEIADRIAALLPPREP